MVHRSAIDVTDVRCSCPRFSPFCDDSDLLQYMDTSETTVRQVVSGLADHGVVKRDGSRYALDVDGLQECVRVAERQRDLQERRGE